MLHEGNKCALCVKMPKVLFVPGFINEIELYSIKTWMLSDVLNNMLSSRRPYHYLKDDVLLRVFDEAIGASINSLIHSNNVMVCHILVLVI
ncbi:hypothetical protein L1987_55708 [Smallanthus sonchifolius]|uniref:Uncharacterized protein n=1 Tax=Smallanthus sonchifolius TaxID=185202 RepID=A0ACB9EAE9_9ASTR|nr:hypothetical protein L1987_55708 [Smallanthus sonchifolius]